MINFVYFDVGGVAILDFTGTQKWEQLKRDIGVHENNKEAFDKVWLQYRERICVDVDVDSLLPILTEEVGLQFPEHYSLLQNFVDRFDANPSIFPVIKKAHLKSKIGLLTNMYLRMFEAIQKKGLLPSVHWDTIIDSSVVKYQKPDRKIFEIAEKEAGVARDSILFVENSMEHILAAKEFGWQTFLYDSAKPEESNNKLISLLDEAL